MKSPYRTVLDFGLPLLLVVFVIGGAVGCAQQKVSTRPDWSASPVVERQDDRPPTPRTLSAMARVLAAQGKDAESVYVLNRLLQEHPKYLPAYNELAEVHLHQGRVDEAVQVLEAGLAQSPNDAVLLNNLGMCHLVQEQPDVALVAFESAAAAAPYHDGAKTNTAVALGLMGRYDEACAAYQLVFTPAESHYNVGVLAEARGDDERASAEYREAHALDGRIKVENDLKRIGQQ